MQDHPALAPFETASSRYEAVFLVSFQAPEDEAEAILDRLAAVDPLVLGAYDRCSWQSAPGLERYRPRPGAMAGAEEALRRRPGIVEVSFQIGRDPERLARVVEAIAAAHSYQEPVVLIREALASRAKGGDADNPNRWWNRGGDWKDAAP
ncbi:hypothetical protein [Labrys wisconsinensis]|uniref:Uncharacterized protein n=1 Tax=Labrys wisconsinensis TaxID=425677 RepID=A0ABU0JBI1_9HYPH|nr:hypothetical protein [Labrys wisconsinensis]MDQ0471641.1 hypothetical protein [Labrys wisconsinensis]